MTGENPAPQGLVTKADIEPSEARAGNAPPALDAPTFAHRTYGELVKQFGRNSTHTFSSWDQLPALEQEKWVSAFAVVHADIFRHGPPKTEGNLLATARSIDAGGQ
jgi:hypothetical protein